MSDIHLEPLADLESAREIWEPLAERSGNVFSTWEWVVLRDRDWDGYRVGFVLLVGRVAGS